MPDKFDKFPTGRSGLELHCPYDETQLRQGDRENDAECPVCRSVFPKSLTQGKTYHD